MHPVSCIHSVGAVRPSLPPFVPPFLDHVMIRLYAQVNLPSAPPPGTASPLTPPTLRAWMQACVLAWGGPWQVTCCEIRSSGGVAMRCFKSARMHVMRCGVGGLGAADDLASMAVSVQEQANCVLEGSAIEKTLPVAGGGVRFRDAARGEVRECVARPSGHMDASIE